MKKWIFTLAIPISIFTVSCSKDNVTEEDDPMVASLSAGEDMATNWEGGYAWQQSDSADYIVFSHVRNMPQLTSAIIEKGAVLVALKNVPYKEDSLQTVPKLAPFSVIPYYGHDEQGKPQCDQRWYDIPSVGKIEVKYRTNRHQFSEMPVLAPDGRVQARYFILTEADLKRLGYTQHTIEQLTYEKLVKLIGVSE